MSLAHDSDRADDLVQETFMRAMANLQLLEMLNTYQVRSLLYRTLRNRFIDERRAMKHRHALFEQLLQEAEAEACESTEVDSLGLLARRSQGQATDGDMAIVGPWRALLPAHGHASTLGYECVR